MLNPALHSTKNDANTIAARNELTLIIERMYSTQFLGSVEEIPGLVVIGESYAEVRVNLFNALNYYFACQGKRLPATLTMHTKIHLPHSAPLK
jgi:predicted RNase H-like HicB family nuclease